MSTVPVYEDEKDVGDAQYDKEYSVLLRSQLISPLFRDSQGYS